LLVRRPLSTGKLRGSFGLSFNREIDFASQPMHTGVDWEVPALTDVCAAGAGVVEEAEAVSSNGYHVRLHHANFYRSSYATSLATNYANLSSVAPGIVRGAQVRQGQVLGYVGTSEIGYGQLHYEILVNGRFVDPMRIRLPSERVLDGAELVGFHRERDHFDAASHESQPIRFYPNERASRQATLETQSCVAQDKSVCLSGFPRNHRQAQTHAMHCLIGNYSFDQG
jgi:murein DD-endopeptidase MepM/ murein hydrolase activator NlpD